MLVKNGGPFLVKTDITPNFVMGGTLSPGVPVITNEAAGLGANAGGGIQIVTPPGGVRNLWFYMLDTD
jgi:hypothetical protein